MPNLLIVLQTEVQRMEYFKGKTGLHLPQKTGKTSSNREITPKAIEEWRSQLSLNDLSTSAKAIYLVLQDCHEANLVYQERFEILCVLRPTLAFINQSLQKHCSGREVLTDNQLIIADLVNALLFEMINEYKLVIEGVYRPFFCNKKVLFDALQNAMSYCIKIIFNAYEQHRSPPPGIWLELHQLFVFAQTKGFANKTLNKVISWHSRFKTLADIYKHCLLFSISNPNQLRREQMADVSFALETWAPLLILRKGNTATIPLFVADVTNDAPPCYAALYFMTPQECYFLDLEKINERVTKLMVAQKKNQPASSKFFTTAELALPKSFLESLMNAWQYLSERDEREKIHGHISVCLGIAATHWYLVGDIKSGSNHNESDAASNTQIIDIDVLPSQHKAFKHQLFICELVNQSEGGYCLKWSHDIPHQLQTGEIIALEKKLDSGEITWEVGTLRWLKAQENQITLVGVEILSNEALAVKAHLTDAASSFSIPTLLFADQPEKKKPLRLITPPLPFKVGNQIEVEFEGKNYPALLVKTYSASASYQEFAIQFLEEQLIFPHKKEQAVQPSQSALRS